MVRHGRTTLNLENKYQGVNQSDLHSLGIEDIKSISQKLKVIIDNDVGISNLYCSPLKRAVQSAQIILEQLSNTQFNYSEAKELRERDCGMWEGLTKAQAQEKFPKVYKQYRFDKFNTRLPGGESIKDVHARVEPFVQSLVKDSIIVSHQTTIRVLIEIIIPRMKGSHSEIIVPHGTVIVCDKLTTRKPTLTYL